MSDGGKESGTDNQKSSSSSKRKQHSGSDEFGRTVARIAVAQICETKGFQNSHRSAIDALADVAVRYIRDLGRVAVFHANLSGRTASNVFDVIQGIEELGSSLGFTGASDVNHCLVGSGVVRELTQFVGIEDEVPFARPIPSFPIICLPNHAPSFAQRGEESKGKHIPKWLPAFPDPHTYIHTPIWDEKKTDLRAEKLEQVRQRRKQERSLLNLQQRLASCNGTPLLTREIDNDIGKGKQVDGNPFLAPPLPPGGKEVSEVGRIEEPASGKRLSVLEVFAPAIEAAKSRSLEPGVSEKKFLPDKRPTIRFQLRVEKKYVTVPFSQIAPNHKAGSWLLRQDEKDDRKRRAEMILKESMENPHELTQL